MLFLICIRMSQSFGWARWSSLCLPEEDAQDICHKKDKTHIGGEALGVLRPPDVSVLGDVRHHPAEDHRTGGDPQHQLVKDVHKLLKHLIFHI